MDGRSDHPAVEDGWAPSRMRKLRLTFPCDAMRETLMKALGENVGYEAAVYATTAIEEMCREILELAASLAEDGLAKAVQRRGKHNQLNCGALQLAMCKSEEIGTMCLRAERLQNVLGHYRDERTSAALKELNLDHIGAIKKLSRQNGAVKDSRTEKQSMWERRRDDLVTDSDLVKLLMYVNPAYGLTNDARMFLTVLVREMVAEILEGVDVGLIRAREEEQVGMTEIEHSLNTLVPGALGASISRRCKAAVDRYNLKSGKEKVVRICFRSMDGNRYNCKCPRSAPLGRFMERASMKLHMDGKSTIFVYGGRRIEKDLSAFSIGMDAGRECREHVIFAFPAKWWQHRQRANARRGLLVSGKEKDVSALLSRVQAKVDNKVSPQRLSPLRKRRRRRRQPALPEKKEKKGRSSPTRANGQGAPKEAPQNSMASKLRRPKTYRFSKHHNATLNRLVRTPTNGETPDFSGIDNAQQSPERKIRKPRRRRRGAQRKGALLGESELERENVAASAQPSAQETSPNGSGSSSSSRARRHWMQNKIAKREQGIMHAREQRRQKFRILGSSALRDAEKVVDAWMKYAQYSRMTRDWVTDKKSLSRTMEDEEQECFRKARHLRTLLDDAAKASKLLRAKSEKPLNMLIHWNEHIPVDATQDVFGVSPGKSRQESASVSLLPSPAGAFIAEKDVPNGYLKSSMSLPKIGGGNIIQSPGKRVSFSNTVQVAQ
eukprot:g1105.t1